MANNWRIYGTDTIACKLSKAELPGFFQKKITVGPQEVALIVKNGKIQETVTQSKEVVLGFWERLKSLFSIDTEVDVYIVDITPVDIVIFLGKTDKGGGSANAKITGPTGTNGTVFSKTDSGARAAGMELTGPGKTATDLSNLNSAFHAQRDISSLTIMALSADHEVITAECRLKISIATEDIRLLSNILRGRSALSTWDITALIKDELLAKVLLPQIAKLRSEEFRGNRELLKKMEDDVTQEMQRTLSAWGITLENFVINWGLTEPEIIELDKKRQQREEDAINFTHRRHLADMQRNLDIEKNKLDNLQQLKVAEANHNEELKAILLAAEVDRENIVDGKRVNIAKIDAQIQEIQFEVYKKESVFRLDQRHTEQLQQLDIEEKKFKLTQESRIANLEADDKEMRSLVEMQIKMSTASHERRVAERRQEIEADFTKQQAALEAQLQQIRIKLDESKTRMGMIGGIISQAITAGAVTPEVLKTFLEQSTEQEYATTSDNKVKSRSEAQSAKNNLGAYKEAEDRDRKHQVDMTGQAANMMQSAKQNVPETLVQGGGITPKVNVSIPAGQPGEQDIVPFTICPYCGKRLKLPKTPNFCPYCEEKLVN
jgi:hypothetical protein